MKVVQDERFREEAARFSLRWNCEDCARFRDDAVNPRCAHGLPVERHRRSRYEDPNADVFFCKEFDLR